MNDSHDSSEDQNVNRTVGSKDEAPEVSEEEKDSIGNWTRGQSCYILANKLSTLFPCHEAEFKGD